MATGNAMETIDPQILADLERDTSRDLIPELVQLYLDTAAARAGRMTAALPDADLAVIASEAHALKSSSATFGAFEVQRLSLKIENHALEGDAAAVTALMPELSRAMAAANTALRAYVDDLTE
ncbi:MAG: Hpt domain-containing protein [Rhodospirillaceae bacterium]